LGVDTFTYPNFLYTPLYTFILPGDIIRSEEGDHPQRSQGSWHVHSSHHVTRNFWKHLLWQAL